MGIPRRSLAEAALAVKMLRQAQRWKPCNGAVAAHGEWESRGMNVVARFTSAELSGLVTVGAQRQVPRQRR
jgi:hypothetical protein